MIVSHRHRFVFVKTVKTAGTSMEIALSKYLGPDDVITPITPADERIREELGYRGPQNDAVPYSRYGVLDALKAMRRRERFRFYNHASASYIRNFVGRRRWASYYTFCFERNPWDKAVSMYYWVHKDAIQGRGDGDEPSPAEADAPPSVAEWVDRGGADDIPGIDLYTVDGRIAVDDVFRYEELDEAVETIAARIGLPEIPELPRAKAAVREPGSGYRDVLTPSNRERIARLRAREIEMFGYAW